MINCFVRSPVFQGDPSMKVFCLFPAYSTHTVFTEHTKNLLVTSDVTYPFFFSFFLFILNPSDLWVNYNSSWPKMNLINT